MCVGSNVTEELRKDVFMIFKKDPIASLHNLTEEKTKLTNFLKQRENDYWTKKWHVYLLWSILTQKN